MAILIVCIHFMRGEKFVEALIAIAFMLPVAVKPSLSSEWGQHRKVSVSEFVRQSVLANMRYMRRQSREAWSKQAS
jgi:hypothetical protein